MDADGLLANMTLREALTEALDTWELYPLRLDKKVQILLDIFAASALTPGGVRTHEQFYTHI